MPVRPFVPAPYPALQSASGGRMLPLQTAVAGSDPALIRWYFDQIILHYNKLADCVAQLETKKKELAEVWPEGSARDRAAEQVTTGIDSFLTSLRNVVQGAHTVAGTGQVVQGSQEGLTSIASAMEPLVAALMSNPWTQGQGVATAAATVGWISQLFTALGGVFTALGQTKLGEIFTQLGTVASAVQKMITASSGSPAAPAPGPTQPAVPPATPAGAPYGAGPPGGSPAAFATGPNGLPYGYALDPATGNVVATGYDPTTGQPFGSGALGDWVPVDIGSGDGPGAGGSGSGGAGDDGGSGEAGTGGSGSSASTNGDDTTVVTVSSEGESVTFEVAATDPTTITAEVGSDDSPTEVSITVTPSTA